ncbi:MAG: GTP-binding protein [Methylomonas sp.]|jgi:G3E family GTPase|uniref:CobW family GTP-binding protein n=1 Tax=Methylomonas sp. TaxID=418 RepID=UPI0025F6CB58|nr:GTP-binding protein [Methylomonas sp.]MCK9607628.1 GTP-binding protein [Methylomonas sp.]
MKATKIPVIVITGFLGSGKTTLLNRLLADNPNTAVIINEFGNTPVDQDLIEQQGLPLTTLAGGCMCCQIKGTLAPTLRNLWMAWEQAAQKPFQRMIIETSGIASPEPILDTLLRDKWLSGRYHLLQVITTLAIPSAIEQLNRFAEAKAQVAWADTLLLTHADLADEDQKAALEAQLAALAPTTPRFETVTARLSAAQIPDHVPAMRRLPNQATPIIHGFSSLSLHLQTRISWPQLETILQNLVSEQAADLVRIKGVVLLLNEPQPMVIQAAGQRLYPPAALSGRATDDLRSRLIFITRANQQSLAEQILQAFGAIIDKSALRLHAES